MNKTKIKEELICRLAGAATGLSLAIPNLYPVWAPLQLMAFVPIFYLAIGRKVGHKGMLIAGMYAGLAYTLPQLFILRLPIPMSSILLVYLTVLLTIYTWACAWLLRSSTITAAFAAGALLVVLDWLNITLVPIWGTAQSLVRCWSWYPHLISFTSITGIAGIVFLLATLQALFVNFIIHPKLRTRLLLIIAALVLLTLATNIMIQQKPPAGKIKVAAAGWTLDDATRYGEVYSQTGFDTLFSQPVARAANEGARLVVFPELGFQFAGRQREEWLDKFAQVARRHSVYLAIGYFNGDKEENRVLFMDPNGTVLSEYTKTYLTVFEDFKKGDGRLSMIEIDGVRTGAMICQDDNFTRFSREYGRKRLGIVAVPTLDWQQIKNVHLQNSIHRAIESRYAIVRAAFNGISAIISPLGEVLAYKDHFEDGNGIIIAEVPYYTDTTFFSIAGNWFVVPSFIFLVITIGWNLRKTGLKNLITHKRLKEKLKTLSRS